MNSSKLISYSDTHIVKFELFYSIKYSYPVRTFIKGRKYQMVRHSNQLYNHIWCSIFTSVPIRLIKSWIYFNFNVKTPFFLKMHTSWKKVFSYIGAWDFFQWTSSNATRKTTTHFFSNFLRVNPYFYWTIIDQCFNLNWKTA